MDYGIKLSQTQIEIMQYMQQNMRRDIDLEELAKIVYGDRYYQPKNWKNSICVMMRVIIEHSKLTNYSIYRSSGLGRGNMATYYCAPRRLIKAISEEQRESVLS